MLSPISGKQMKLVKMLRSFQFRKEDFSILYHYYLCEDSQEPFTNDELDNINQIQVHNQYREKYGIPFPEEIIEIRNKYNVSANKMSEILGLGQNTYRLYESGEMPSVSNGRLILSISQPEEFIRQVKASSHLLPSKEVEKYICKAKEIQVKENEYQFENLFQTNVILIDKPNEFTGYKLLNLNKASQVISYFGEQTELFKTKLNKLLFYSDFLVYQIKGQSMTGLKYRAIHYGPVPSNFEKLYLKLQDDKKIEIAEVGFDNGNFGEVIKPLIKFDSNSFTQIELNVLNAVILRFKGMTSKQIADLSHEELAWKENKDEKNFISYQKYSYGLKAISRKELVG